MSKKILAIADIARDCGILTLIFLILLHSKTIDFYYIELCVLAMPWLIPMDIHYHLEKLKDGN